MRNKKNKYLGEINPEEILIDVSNLANFNLQQMEGSLSKVLDKKSIYIMSIFILFILSFFLYKMYNMQIINSEHYVRLAERNKFRSSPIFPKRGPIYDRSGVLLTWNSVSTNTQIIKRNYIESEGFSNLLGYVSYPKIDKSGVFWQSEYIGRDGLEKYYQNKLNGKAGSHIYEVSATGDILPGKVTQESKDGEELNINIDSKVQSQLYKYIKELAIEKGFHGGAAVIMNVNDGSVVSLVSYPEYNNNIMTNSSTTEEKNMINNWLEDKDNKFSNRAVAGLYTPGSTVKPFMAYGALKENLIDEYKSILSKGKIIVKNMYGGPDAVFKDWKVHGYVDMRHAIAVSSDEYFYQIGGGYGDQEGLGIDRIYKYMSLFGFASSTNIDINGEKVGNIPNKAWKEKKYKDGNWRLGDTYNTSIGQYGYQTTPIELARSLSLLANGSYLPTPRIYGTSTDKVYINLDLDKLNVVREGMRLAVTDQNVGTVRSLYVNGINVAAKSGTAELGVRKDRVNSWVMGYFPYDKPKYAFVVIMENGDVNNLIGASSVMRKLLTHIVENKDHYEYMF